MANDRNQKELQQGDVVIVQAEISRIDEGDILILQDLGSDNRFHLPAASTEKLTDLLGDHSSELEHRLKAVEANHETEVRDLHEALQAMTQERDRLAQELLEKQPVAVPAEDQPQEPSPVVEGETPEISGQPV